MEVTPEIDVEGEYEMKCKREIGLGLVNRKITVTFETVEAAEKFCDYLPIDWDEFKQLGNQVSVIAICDFVGEIWHKILSYEVDLSDQVLVIQLEKIHLDIPMSNKEQLERLSKLMESAANEATVYRKSTDDKEMYDRYRNFCFSKIWEEFWEITRHITGVSGDYHDPDTTYEEDLEAYLDRARLFIDSVSNERDISLS